MKQNFKLGVRCAVALLACVLCPLAAVETGSSYRLTFDSAAPGAFSNRGRRANQSNVKGNQNNSRKEKPGIFAVVIRLVFGRNASGKSLLRILNQGESPKDVAMRGVRYETATKNIHDLGSPPGARAIVLRAQAREAFYLLDGRLFRSELSDALTFKGQPKQLNLENQTFLTSLIGFVADAPSELLAISGDNALVRVSSVGGKVVTVEAKLSASDVWEVSQQSVAPDGAVAHVDQPEQGVWNILIWPKGENSLGAELIEASAGVKLDPRWSDDGSNLIFVQEQPAKEQPVRRQP